MTIKDIAYFTEVAEKVGEVGDLLSLMWHKNQLLVHMREASFFGIFPNYTKCEHSEEFDKCYLTIGQSQFFCLVYKYKNERMTENVD